MENLSPSELMKLATSGNKEAIEKVVDLQREGKCLRYYPNGRRSADDEGRFIALRTKVGMSRHNGRGLVAIVVESGLAVNVYPLPVCSLLEMAAVAIERFRETHFPRLLHTTQPMEVSFDGTSVFWAFPGWEPKVAFAVFDGMLLTVLTNSLMQIQDSSMASMSDACKAGDLLEEIAQGMERDGTAI